MRIQKQKGNKLFVRDEKNWIQQPKNSSERENG
jgi:hypothetical protein